MSAEASGKSRQEISTLFFKHYGLWSYLAAFALFFVSYPLNGSLVADMDLWVYLGAFNYYYESILSWFTGAEIGIPFYPHPNPYLNGEPCFGIFPFWLPFHLLGLNEIFAFYGLYVILFTLNALAVFRLSQTLFPQLHPGAKWLAGLFFTLNNFMLANIDNPNTVCFAPGLWAMASYVEWMKPKKKTQLLIFVAGMLFQLYASAYNFMYAGLFVLCFTLFQPLVFWRRFRQMPFFSLSAALALFSGMAAYLYLLTVLSDKSQSYNYSTTLETVKFVSFSTLDFIRVLPGNLYHHSEPYFFWLMQYKSLFLGLVLTGLGLAGWFWSLLRYPFLILLAAISFTIGAGTYFDWGTHRILLPLGWLFETFDLYSFYRVPFRIFMLPMLMLSIGAALPVSYWLKTGGRMKWAAVMIGLLFLMENVPLKRTHYASEKYVREAAALKEKFAAEPQSVFLFLPCGDVVNGQSPLINRSEYIVHFYQSKIKKNVVNGYISFFPPPRMELNTALLAFDTQPELLRKYLRKYRVKTIVYYGREWGFVETGMSLRKLTQLAEEEKIRLVLR